MAITRCPYCHAIIDENDKYCNNCGTQLLFAEDEEIEEEIPGEKIIDAQVEEKDYTVEEPGDEAKAAPAEDLEAEIDEELEEEIPEETEEVALEELVAEEAEEEAGDELTEEVLLADEIEAAELPKAEETGPVDEAGAAGPEEPAPKALDDAGEEVTGEPGPAEEAEEEPVRELEEETGEEPAIEYVSIPETPDEAATAGEAGLRQATFDTQDLEDLGETVELGKRKVDELVEVMAEERAVTPPPLAEEPVREPPVEAPPQKTPTSEPRTGTLPPWASTMKGAPVFQEDTGPVETRRFGGGEPGALDTEEEVEIFPRRRAPDSTVGLPEKIAQAPLPFGSPTPEALEPAEPAEEAEEVLPLPDEVRPARPSILPVRGPAPESPSRREAEEIEEAEETAPRPPAGLSAFFKSKAFDLLFVGLFWLVALWMAASSMGRTLFDILGSMSGSMLVLYAVFALLYFFLFKFFIGETIGDRLFRRRD